MNMVYLVRLQTQTMNDKRAAVTGHVTFSHFFLKSGGEVGGRI